MASLTLAQPLDKRTTTGTLYTSGPEHALTCYACGHRCRIKPVGGGSLARITRAVSTPLPKTR